MFITLALLVTIKIYFWMAETKKRDKKFFDNSLKIKGVKTLKFSRIKTNFLKFSTQKLQVLRP
jgi:hypothetical protein